MTLFSDFQTLWSCRGSSSHFLYPFLCCERKTAIFFCRERREENEQQIAIMLMVVVMIFLGKSPSSFAYCNPRTFLSSGCSTLGMLANILDLMKLPAGTLVMVSIIILTLCTCLIVISLHRFPIWWSRSILVLTYSFIVVLAKSFEESSRSFWV